MSNCSTQQSTPRNLNSFDKYISEETHTYKKKGYGLIMAILMFSFYFFVFPDILQIFWTNYMDNFDYKIKSILAQWLTSLLTLAIGNFLYFLNYRLESPFFEKYRILKNRPWPWKENPEKWAKLSKNCWKLTLINVFCISLPLTLIDC